MLAQLDRVTEAEGTATRALLVQDYISCWTRNLRRFLPQLVPAYSLWMGSGAAFDDGNGYMRAYQHADAAGQIQERLASLSDVLDAYLGLAPHIHRSRQLVTLASTNTTTRRGPHDDGAGGVGASVSPRVPCIALQCVDVETPRHTYSSEASTVAVRGLSLDLQNSPEQPFRLLITGPSGWCVRGGVRVLTPDALCSLQYLPAYDPQRKEHAAPRYAGCVATG